MKQKILYITIVVLSFGLGITSTLLYKEYIGDNNTIIEKTVSEVNITESNTISTAIEKIYDAVYVVETYKNGRSSSSGTGFAYKKDETKGYIITNYHVIEGGSSYKVYNSDGEQIDASLLGGDEYADIAILAIDASKITQIAEIGDSSEAKLGDTVFTVGTPIGKNYIGTVTKGILSGKDRTVSVKLSSTSFMMEVLQTDAAINPGNSGGPLVNINGEVIGINSMKLVEDEIEGMGFSIPVEYAMAIVDILEKGEQIQRPIIGVELSDISYAYQLYMRENIKIDENLDYGAVVVNVLEGLPAEEAGLKKGDVILTVDGAKIVNTGHFRFILFKYKAGDTVQITYSRNGEVKLAKVKLVIES